jgi:hypothetical protein
MIMKKLIVIALSSLFIFIFSGCVTTKQDIGKTLPDNYYVLNCESFPAEGFAKNNDVEINYKISKIENNKYLITGIFTPVFGGALTTAEDQELSILFFLLKGKLVVDSVTVPIQGNLPGTMSLNTNFISEADFDGITIGRFTGRFFISG